MQEMWDQVQAVLKQDIGKDTFDIWFGAVELVHLDTEVIHLHVPNRYVRDWIRGNLDAALGKALLEVSGSSPSVLLDISGTAPAPEPAPEPAPVTTTPAEPSPATPAAPPATAAPEAPATPASPPATTPDPPDTSHGIRVTIQNHYINKTFDNFVVGSCNQFAHACAQAVAEEPGTPGYNPLFIYGSTGLGKTHLLHAIGNAILAEKPNTHILYTTAEQFTNSLVAALKTRTMDGFREHVRHQPDLLIIDDIQFFGGKARTQEELFHTFEELSKNGKQIVFAADVLPRDIRGFEPRLRSRCESGMLADMQAPDLETITAILQQKADEMHLSVPNDLAEYIGARVRGSVRELEGALNRLQGVCRMRHTEPSMELAQEYFKNILSEATHRPGATEIIQTVASFFNIEVNDLKGSRRHKQIVRPRHIAMWMVRQHTQHSFPEIGRIFNRDNATVQHACKKISTQMSTDVDLRNTVDTLARNLGL